MQRAMEVMLPIKDMVPILTQVTDMVTTTCSQIRGTQTSNITIGMYSVTMESHPLTDYTTLVHSSLHTLIDK